MKRRKIYLLTAKDLEKAIKFLFPHAPDDIKVKKIFDGMSQDPYGEYASLSVHTSSFHHRLVDDRPGHYEAHYESTYNPDDK